MLVALAEMGREGSLDSKNRRVFSKQKRIKSKTKRTPPPPSQKVCKMVRTIEENQQCWTRRLICIPPDVFLLLFRGWVKSWHFQLIWKEWDKCTYRYNTMQYIEPLEFRRNLKVLVQKPPTPQHYRPANYYILIVVHYGRLKFTTFRQKLPRSV